MIDRFLKAKHWQLFTLMFGIPFLFQIIMIGTMFLNINSETNPDPRDMFNMFKFFPIIMMLYMGIFFGWFWSIAIGLQKKAPKNITMKTRKFKIFFFIPLVYIFCISLFIGGMFGGIMQSGTEPSGGFLGGMVGIILPLHLLSMFGIFYSMYFVAKTFKTVELQKQVSFGDFAGEFFLLWFYFIGIWILQPKINKMAENENTAANPDEIND
ncbi:hypothetical protein [Confluentibacter sediminis]|uniref:hypothetical protein n=1 Tax=Confluentibacter sediminis TaxID=2219045 RepID=UPI000DABF4D5|nr:hypothetical protein [Confluentibacter sediminis]